MSKVKTKAYLVEILSQGGYLDIITLTLACRRRGGQSPQLHYVQKCLTNLLMEGIIGEVIKESSRRTGRFYNIEYYIPGREHSHAVNDE